MIQRSLKQSVNGILLVNKPQGLSSNAILQRVKKLYNAKKAGHTGSLDPLATGMLPICFGEATKFSQYLLDSDKTYQATGCLGMKTTTGDAQGELLQRHEQPFHIEEENLVSVLENFTGQSMQIPSMFSALKHKGIPLYKYARKGMDIERSARPIHIKNLKLDHYAGTLFTITVTCSKGTYIRNLIEDIGDQLGVGAYVTCLHRLSAAGFDAQNMLTLDQLETASITELMNYLLPMETAVDFMPVLIVNEAELFDLRKGKILNKQLDQEGCYRLYDELGQFAGLVEWDKTGLLRVKRLLSLSD